MLLSLSSRYIFIHPSSSLLFDEPCHSFTKDNNRVTVFYDPGRLIKGEDGLKEPVSAGLINSLCILPILSYGATAPLAAPPLEEGGWDAEPIPGCRWRLEGTESDPEDAVLKELMIAQALKAAGGINNGDCKESGLVVLQVASTHASFITIGRKAGILRRG